METIIVFLSAVPNVIWAAIIASLLTFSGVLLTNRHYSKQQKAQLEHEKKENEAERKFELRQSVYLGAADELTMAMQHLMNLSNIDITKENPADSLTGFFVATNRACLVASDNTATAINELLATYSEAYFFLLAKTLPIQEIRTERNIQNDAYERHQAEVSRILASMTQFNEEAKADSEVWRALSKSLDFSMEQADKSADARDNAGEELNSLKFAFAKQALPELKKLSKLTIPALVAIRTELEISTDIDAYQAEFEKRQQRVTELFESFLAGIDIDAT